jgi:hypothetical protein
MLLGVKPSVFVDQTVASTNFCIDVLGSRPFFFVANQFVATFLSPTGF